MLKRKIKINNKYGIHARPSSMISELASQYKSSISIEYREKTADASSIMNLILLCVEPKTEVELVIEGEDEEKAMEAMVYLLEVQFTKEEFD